MVCPPKRRPSFGVFLHRATSATGEIVGSKPCSRSFEFVAEKADVPEVGPGSGNGVFGASKMEPRPASRRRSLAPKALLSRKHRHRQELSTPELPPTLQLDLPFSDGEQAAEEAESTMQNGSQVAATQDAKTRPDERQHERSDNSAARAAARSSARLTPSQVSDLIKLAGSEIRQRGLAQVGIFRPLRVGTNQAAVERLIELALLDAEPDRYGDVFSSTQSDAVSSSWVSESLAIAKPDTRRAFVKELAYAGVNDVAELIKWAYRHLHWGSQAFSVSWYTTFVNSERDSQYPLDAYTKLLLPNISEDAQQLLEETFGLLSTVVAHHVANTMSAERMCKTFGFWLFKGADTDVNTASAEDLQGFVRQWKRCTRQMEHLFLAYSRDQSSRLQYIPTRLTQLLQGYPVISGDAELRAPGLQRVSNPSSRALLLSMEANSASRNQRRRSSRDPLRMLNDALDATIKEGDLSPEADDWSSVVKLTGRADQGETEVPEFSLPREDSQNGLELSAALQMEEAQPRPTDDGAEGNSISRIRHILFEEDVRMLTVVSEELERRGKSGAASGDGMSTSRQLPSRPEDVQAIQSAQWPRSMAPSLLDTDSFMQSHRGHRDPVMLPPVREDSSTSLAIDANGPNGWSAFEQTGFNDTSTEPHFSSPLKLSIDQATEGRPTLEPIASSRRRGSAIGAIRRAASVGALRRSSSQVSALPTLPDGNDLHDDRNAEAAKISKISAIEFDEVLASVWQDTLLDDSAAPSLPDFVAVRLNAKAALRLISLGPEALETQGTTHDRRSSRSPPSLLNTGSLGSRSLPWLIVETRHETDGPAAAAAPIQPKPKKPRHSFSAESRSALRLVAGGGSGDGGDRHSRPFGRALSLRRSRTFNKQQQQDEARLSFGGSRTDLEQVSHGVGEADAASIDDRRSLFAPSVRSLKAKLAVPSALSRHRSVKRVSSAFGLRRDRGPQPPLPTVAHAEFSGHLNGGGPHDAATAPGYAATAEPAKKSSANEQSSADESANLHLLAPPAQDARALYQTSGQALAPSTAASAAKDGHEDAAAKSAASALSDHSV